MLILRSSLVFALAAYVVNAVGKYAPEYDYNSNLEQGSHYRYHPQPKQHSTIRKEWYDAWIFIFFYFLNFPFPQSDK